MYHSPCIFTGICACMPIHWILWYVVKKFVIIKIARSMALRTGLSRNAIEMDQVGNLRAKCGLKVLVRQTRAAGAVPTVYFKQTYIAEFGLARLLLDDLYPTVFEI